MNDIEKLRVLLPHQVIEHLKGCPDCEVQHREELRHLICKPVRDEHGVTI